MQKIQIYLFSITLALHCQEAELRIRSKNFECPLSVDDNKYQSMSLKKLIIRTNLILVWMAHAWNVIKAYKLQVARRQIDGPTHSSRIPEN